MLMGAPSSSAGSCPWRGVGAAEQKIKEAGFHSSRTIWNALRFCDILAGQSQYFTVWGYAMFRILVVEDDAQFNRNVCSYLERNGYAAEGCGDGFAFAKAVREQDKLIPILLLTDWNDFSAKSEGFRIGVDDFMVKPVDMDELVLRVGALLRRANIITSRRLTVGGLTLDADELSANLDGEDIPLTVKEFNILYKLLSYPRRTFTRAQLMDEFWGLDSDTTSRSVDVFITRLRSKFAGCGAFEIVTIRGLGYKAG